MAQLKKKPKPFKAMKKSRRLMVFASVILVLFGCLVLYLAMQNENWTQDEPTQREVFLLASLLMITSIALCYYALNGDLLEDKERTDMEANHLTSVKFGDYNSIKSGSLLPTYPQPQINSVTEDRLLELLEPSFSYERIDKPRKNNDREQKHRSSQSIQPQEVLNSCYCKTGVHQKTSVQDYTTGLPSNSEKSSDEPVNPEKRNRSLIVELMPLLPLQLCERELANLNFPQPLVDSLQEQSQFPLTDGQINPNLPNPFGKGNKNSDAG